MATLAPNPTLNLWGVLAGSRRIINAHSRHFLALSVFFLLPLSFSLFIYPTFQTTLSQSQTKPTRLLLRNPLSSSTSESYFLAFPFIYSLFVSFLSLCAVASITHSTYHGFFGRPVKLASAMKSLLRSFVPLVITTICSLLALSLVCALFGLLVILVARGAENLGFAIDYDSNYFRWSCIVIAVIAILVLVHLEVKWALASVIVVTESKWGFEPLWRSAYLVKGMRTVSLSLILYFGTTIGFFIWCLSGPNPGSFSDMWKCLLFIIQTVLGSSVVTGLMLMNVAARTVLYLYCKALHGELAWEIAEEFAHEYVSLPFDDAKIPHVVFVAQA
ncbi:hypothetical protein NMG60_11036136 [Bertholletia excelsa]